MEEEKRFSSFIFEISRKLSSIQIKAPWGDQVEELAELLQMDAEVLKMFCICLETWDFPTTHLRVIWTKEHKGRQSILNRLIETWPVDVQSFHSLAFELEGIIQQSKLQIGGWCNNYLVQYSSMQCKSSTFDETQHFLSNLLRNIYTRYFPIFEKQVITMTNKIVFLNDSLDNVESCKSSEKCLEFMNFVHAFANSAACLTCLYWAKEGNEESVTEMNTVLFNMLHKFIPSAPHIAPLYIGILKSNNLQPSDSFLPGVAAESFVDFFFEHLATILKDNFLILRNRLIFLFKFLIDPPCENAEEEDLICSLIYALFQHEDAYLLLPFDEMKKDFLHHKTLLSDCMIKIETASAKIRQLYCQFSDSWIRLEVEKMDYNYFVSVQRELSSIEKHARWADKVQDQLHLNKMELRFLRMVLLSFATWDDTDEEIRVRLSFMITSLQGIWGKEEENAVRLHEIRNGDVEDWHLLDLVGKIQQSKLQIEAWCVDLIHWSFLCKPSISKTSQNITNFLDCIIDNLNDLVSYRAGKKKFVPFKMQIETLKEKLVFLQNMLKLNANCTDSKELEEFNMFVQVFAKDAACLTFLYWAKEASDKIATELNLILSRMLQKIKPVTPNIAGLYFGALKTIYSQRSEPVLFGQTASSFVHFFLKDPATPLKDDFQILEEDIIFLLSFLNDPPNRNEEVLICSQIDALFWDGVYGLLPFDDMEGDFSKKKVILSDFMFKIETMNSNIRQLYCKFPASSVYNLPKVVSPRFLDFLIHNLRNLEARMLSDKKYVPFAKYKIKKIVEELVCLGPFFNHIVDLPSEPNDTWFQVVDLIHLIEHVINSCIRSWFHFDRPIWYCMANLSDVLDRIKVVNTTLETIKEKNMYNARCLPHSIGFISTLSEQARTSENNEVVGFEDDAEKIIGKLTWEYMPLDIVSIVGMGGLGKTTLAKKIYGSSLVKIHFNIFAFCTVSQDHNTKRLLLDILCDIKGEDKKFLDMTNDDLAHQIWKRLSRQRYLIVLDDIWNASVWNEIKRSFPDHKNGSRIMFTTRSFEVANECKIKCSPHHLRLLTKDESWELLRKKVFHNDISPPNLCEIGKVIAKNCKGLPLAVVVIAGVLARIERRESMWSEITERVGAYLSEEGCMSILEISYTHLPNHLKPCFLYLGAFPEDYLFKVKRVILLWIAEGFVQEFETKSLEDVAKEYLRNLLDRSLVIVGATSSSGEIKTFRVHDLIHDLCRMKCRDGDFFQLINGTAKYGSSDHSLHSPYRVSMWTDDDVSSLFNAHTLLLFYGSDIFLNDISFSTKFKHAQVLYTENSSDGLARMTSLLHVRHLEYEHVFENVLIPSSISNIWNMQSLIVRYTRSAIEFPETLWRMKSLRHVKVSRCKLTFSDGHEEHDESYPKLDKVVSFSNPFLYSGEDIQQLLHRLPAVRRLSCILDKSLDFDEGPGETLDFYTKQLESLKLRLIGPRSPYLINFPSTLKKLTLNGFQLPWTAISAIVELRALQVLKLQWISFPEPRLEMEDVAFQNLKFFELYDEDLVQWGASDESFPCLEQLLIECKKLEALPTCFKETPTLKKIVIRSKVKGSEVESSALQIREEQMDAGNEVEVRHLRKESESELEEEDEESVFDSTRLKSV